MRTYLLYHFKFWRYLIVAVTLILFVIFGLIYVAGEYDFNLDDGDIVYLILMVLITMTLAILFGARVSTYTYEIEVTIVGLSLKITSPFYFSAIQRKNITWDDIDGYNLEDYGNGRILSLKQRSTSEEYIFTNSILKESLDLFPFYEALKAGVTAFNASNAGVAHPIGKLGGFYASKFAMIIAITLLLLMIVLPFLMFAEPENNFSTFKYLKMIWFYLLSAGIVWRVYLARK